MPQKPVLQSSPQNFQENLRSSIQLASESLLSQRHPDGWWWYTLEANDAINAEYIMLMKYLGLEARETEHAICRWITANQNQDGSWSLYHGGPGDLSATVECYLALKMCGYKTSHKTLRLAKKFILSSGGITKVRVFTRIHLALFGLLDWKHCPKMPVALIQLPTLSPFNIYEFSSWARACIVPLLVIMEKKKICRLSGIDVNELYIGTKPQAARWEFENIPSPLSLENAFIQIDKALKLTDRIALKPFSQSALKKCEAYICEHLNATEDIFPAMFYGILALRSLGYALSNQKIQKALEGLKSFQIRMPQANLRPIPFDVTTNHDPETPQAVNDNQTLTIYQQCCISPVWDTAWAGLALLEAGLSGSDQGIIQTARWLLSKQVTDVTGDWAIKNPHAQPGGWSFEFNNKHYPDLDDTIAVLSFLHHTDLPYRVLKKPFQKGVDWLISMRCKHGGFATFDKDNDLQILNKLPFSDHGACLDPPTVDMTGRVLAFLKGVCEFAPDHPVLQKAADFIVERQEKDGSFWGRWGVNYIYGTWCTLEGLGALGRERDRLVVNRAVHWIKTIQNPDGGFGESCASYKKKHYVPLGVSVPSQTAWALMGLMAAGQGFSEEARRAALFLTQSQKLDGGWEEPYFTGTGFPGHFYIRYHGYRYYFPLLALARYWKGITNESSRGARAKRGDPEKPYKKITS